MAWQVFMELLKFYVADLNASVRVFRPVFALRFRYYWLRLRILFKSSQVKELAVRNWFEELLPVGLNPFDAMTAYKTWTSEYLPSLRAYGVLSVLIGIDDSDFNGHLSNSSYAKVSLQVTHDPIRV